MAELAENLVISEADRLDQAEALVRSYCGWHIAPSRTDTVTVAGFDRVIPLPSLHVTSIVSVTVNGTLLADDAYDCTEAGVLTLGSPWGSCGPFWGRRVVVVVFTHGYDFPPADVTAAVQALAQSAVDNPKRLRSMTRGPFSETYGEGAAALADLDKYKRPSRP